MTDQNPTPYGQPSPQNPYQGQQPTHQGQPYGGQPAYQGQNGAPGQRNTLALVSMILGIAGFLTSITALGAIVTGHMALSQIKKRGEEGRGMALTGLILGYVVVALTIIGIILLVVLFGAIASNPGLYDGSYDS
ncbi:DUF4190 domain-containing protein [Frigoribacterium sp. RIT-PI-h]|uniref:DUF4190 domain-containing protein n=1 Tax=Frigoribacterium sp. RIT-PI-h TaxID=1690245 RepID=UPI0006B99010|nr:DUF4190 domain-containing protein [Frigoribacterium sp. RIT-PI-h]